MPLDTVEHYHWSVALTSDVWMAGVCCVVRVLHMSDEHDVERVSGLVASYAEQPDQPSLSYSSSAAVTGRSKSSTSKPFHHQLYLLTKRAWWQYARQPVHIVARVIENRPRNHTHNTASLPQPCQPSAAHICPPRVDVVCYEVFLTLFIGSLFFQAGHDQRSLYARIAFIFFLVCMQSLVTLVFAVLTCTATHSLRHCVRALRGCAVSPSCYGWTGFGYVS